MWPIFEPTFMQGCQYDVPSFDMPSSSVLIKIGKKINLQNFE